MYKNYKLKIINYKVEIAVIFGTMRKGCLRAMPDA